MLRMLKPLYKQSAKPVKDKNKIRSLYDASSQIYINLYLKEQTDKYRKIPKKIILDSKIILDAGCGPAILNRYIQDNTYYVGLDISFKMLTLGKSIINYENSDLIYADIERPPLREKSFDNIFCITQIHHSKNPKKELKILGLLARNYVIISLLKKVYDKPNLVKSINIIDGEADWILLVNSKDIK